MALSRGTKAQMELFDEKNRRPKIFGYSSNKFWFLLKGKL
jgi:hypothetical protein